MCDLSHVMAFYTVPSVHCLLYLASLILSLKSWLLKQATHRSLIYQFGKLQSLLVGDGIRAWKWNHFTGHLPHVQWCVSSTRCAFIVSSALEVVELGCEVLISFTWVLNHTTPKNWIPKLMLKAVNNECNGLCRK